MSSVALEERMRNLLTRHLLSNNENQKCKLNNNYSPRSTSAFNFNVLSVLLLHV